MRMSPAQPVRVTTRPERRGWRRGVGGWEWGSRPGSSIWPHLSRPFPCYQSRFDERGCLLRWWRAVLASGVRGHVADCLETPNLQWTRCFSALHRLYRNRLRCPAHPTAFLFSFCLCVRNPTTTLLAILLEKLTGF